MDRPLKICLDARMIPGTSGGMQQIVIGLASGFSRLKDGDEEYHFLAFPDSSDWLKPFLKGPCRLLAGPPAPKTDPRSWKGRLKQRLPKSLVSMWARSGWRPFKVPVSDGIPEKSGMDLMHFTWQGAFLTSLPSIYHPYDLQPWHMPQNFSASDLKRARKVYPLFCEQAGVVAVMSRWTREDLAAQLKVPREKICVFPGASVLTAYAAPTEAELAQARDKLQLPGRFFYYPAQTYPHKNHIGLLKGMAWLRDRKGLEVQAVFSGQMNDFYPRIWKQVETLGLQSQVRFLGFLPSPSVACLYRLCAAVVIPSKSEGWNLPLAEAFQAGVPAACADATSLPEHAGGAALLFDPDSPQEIGGCLERLWKDGALRADLADRGRKRAADLSWENTARFFRALYRKMLNRALDPKEQALLAEGFRD